MNRSLKNSSDCVLGNKKYSRFVPLRQQSQILMVILEDKDQNSNERFSYEMSEESRRGIGCVGI